jgi:serine/threonine protein kinase
VEETRFPITSTADSLYPAVGTGGKLRLSKALRMALNIAKAVEEYHGQGLVLSELRPENILLTQQGTAILACFGLGKFFMEGRGPAPDQEAEADASYCYM